MNRHEPRRNEPSVQRFAFRGLQLVVDLLILSLGYWLAFMLRFEFQPDFETFKLLFFSWPYVMILEVSVMTLLGVPQVVWRYVGLKDASRILIALGVSTAVLVVLRLGLEPWGGYAVFVMIPLGILGMNFALAFLGVTGVRVIRRMSYEKGARRLRECAEEPRRTLLIGAGRAGVAAAREIAQHPEIGMIMVGFVDDDPLKVGTTVQGYKVLGNTASLGKVVAQHHVDQAVITIASATGSAIRRIVGLCEEIDLTVRIVPGIHELLEGRINLSRIREVAIEDLLRREAVELDRKAIGTFLTGKRVVVTGAGGSIGSELCRQVCAFHPEQLVLVEQAENSLFHIHQELLRDWPKVRVVPFLADIGDAARIDRLFALSTPHVVFHAAAHKHVPMMELNPGEAIKNNVFGTKMVADAAHRHKAESFVLISTDKAVNPSSIMGASKRVAEIWLQALSRKSATRFVSVRFGNVLGSVGSVVPVFQEQIRRGGPVTVTHPAMKRYFMTIPEACQLVMQAAAMGQGGEIFVLDMGEPVCIVDLARDLIRLSGFTEDEIHIEFTGIRPGEKLFEELSTKSEDLDRTRHPKIFIGRCAVHPPEDVRRSLDLLAGIIDSSSREEVRAALGTLVVELRPQDVDEPAAASPDAEPGIVMHLAGRALVS